MSSRTIAWVSRTSLNLMRTEAVRAAPNETGGVLLGYWSEGSVVVTDATLPGPQAFHDPIAFLPDDEYQDGEIERIYRESGRRHVYLGDWHTHPDGVARLSFADRKILRAIAAHRDARLDTPLMAILGGCANWQLTLWRRLPRCAGNLFLGKTEVLDVRQF